MSDNIYEIAQRLRQTLHSSPETSGNEYETCAILRKYINDYTDAVVTDCGNWFYGCHFEGDGCENVAFRTDIDAISGSDGLPFHGCGHDGHAASMFAFAMSISGQRVGKNVYYIFQPSEEDGRGAIKCKEVLTNNSILKVYGYHNIPGYDVGEILVRAGTFACASKGVTIHFVGKQAHAAYPENGINPAFAIASLVNKIEAITDPSLYSDRVFLTIVHIRVGKKAFGISAGDGEISLTLRAVKSCDLDLLEKNLLYAANSQGIKMSYDVFDEFPETSNNFDCVKSCIKLFQNAGLTVTELAEPFRWSEDFGHYLKVSDGMFFGIGSGKDCSPLHTPEYRFPDCVILNAVRAFRTVLDGNI